MQENLDLVLANACEDQRAHLKMFAETADPKVLARVHFESCSACSRAVSVIELVPEAPKPEPPPYDPANDSIALANLIIGGILSLVSLAATFIGMTLVRQAGHGTRLSVGLFGCSILYLIVRTMLHINDVRMKRWIPPKTAPD